MAHKVATQEIKLIIKEAINHCDTYSAIDRILMQHEIRDTPEEMWAIAAALLELSDEFAYLATK